MPACTFCGQPTAPGDGIYCTSFCADNAFEAAAADPVAEIEAHLAEVGAAVARWNDMVTGGDGGVA